MTKSVGYGHGDSAFYVGETPAQTKPKWTKLDHLDGYENVLGYSGTNSKYVKITQSNFYNNGAGVVPNTLDSERFEPTADRDHREQQHLLEQLQLLPAQLAREDGLERARGDRGPDDPVPDRGRDRAARRRRLDHPEQPDLRQLQGRGRGRSRTRSTRATTRSRVNNQFLNNQMGRGGTDTNAVDFFSDGSGSGNCYSRQRQLDLRPERDGARLEPVSGLPRARRHRSATGTSAGDGEQFGELAGYVTTNPPENQQCSWAEHDAPGVRELQAAERHAGADMLSAPRIRPGRPPGSPRSRSARSRSRRERLRRRQRKTAKVTVADDFFAPTDLKVKKGSKVKWVWDSSNTNTHNVILTSKHPKDVKAIGLPLELRRRRDLVQAQVQGPGQVRVHLHLSPQRDEVRPEGEEVGPA